MTKNVKSAIFDRYVEAENAVKNLRAAGVEADLISIIARENGDTTTVDGDGDQVTSNAAKDVVGKAAAGAGIGALLGVAAMAIPGVGPFVAAGAIAQAAAGGAAITGTAVGAAAGSIAGALTDHGVSPDDSEYYATRLNQGATLVTVEANASNVDDLTIVDLLSSAGGHSSTRTRTTVV